MSAGKKKLTPRQRMINLMYIVLTAMLALNVSSDVLNGFSQVQEALQRTAGNISARNEVQFQYLQSLYEKNPTKTGPWYEKGVDVRKQSNNLYALIDSLKLEIVRNADGTISNEFRLMDPDHPDFEGNATVKKTLRLFLDTMYKIRYPGALESDIENAKESGDYYRVPLMEAVFSRQAKNLGFFKSGTP